MSGKLIVGVDPGLKGGLALVSTNGDLAFSEDLPRQGEGAAARIDAGELARMLRPWLADIQVAVVEAAQAMPKNGASSMFRYLYGKARGAPTRVGGGTSEILGEWSQPVW
jgi:hypothetical protein